MVLLIVASVCVLALSFTAPGPTALDQTVVALIKEFPGLFGWFWEVSYDLVFGWAIFLVVVALFSRGRKRLFLTELMACILALVTGAIAGKIAGTDWSASFGGIGTTNLEAAYPAMRLALATAIIVTVSPHLVRPLRYVGRWIIFFGALAAVALGIALPIGVVAAFAVGVGVGALVHLVVGSPGGRLSLDQIRAALRDLDVVVGELQHSPLEPSGLALARGTALDGRILEVKIYGRDAWDGQLLGSLWSSLWNRGETPSLIGRLERVEHEAFITLLAERAGVPVLPVVAAGMASDSDALLVLEVTGKPLISTPPEDIDDAVLDELWKTLGQLHQLGVAHGRVDGYRMMIRPDGVAAIGDFGDASIAAPASDLAIDNAQLLVTTALIVGVERAVRGAVSAHGADALQELPPYLQPAVLDRASRQELRSRAWDLGDLREAAAQAVGIDPPKLEKIRRVTWTSVAMFALLGLVSYLLISAVAQVGLEAIITTFNGADKQWLLAALLMSPTIQVAQGISTMGASIRRVRLGPVIMLQYAIQFVALAVPSTAARVALEIRFFQGYGLAPVGAVAIGVLDSVCGFVVQLFVILVTLLSGFVTLDLAGASSASADASTSSSHDLSALVILGALFLCLVLVAIAVPRYRRFIRDRISSSAAETSAALGVLRIPKNVAMIFVGQVASQVIQALVLGLCLKAFGFEESLASLILVNTLVSLFAGLMPVPGGVGVAEAGYTAGLVALGVPHDAALSTALAFRAVTFYLPPLWGGFAMRWLRQRSFV